MKYRGNIQGADLVAWGKKHGFRTRSARAHHLRLPIDTLKNYEQDIRPIPAVVEMAMKCVDYERQPI